MATRDVGISQLTTSITATGALEDEGFQRAPCNQIPEGEVQELVTIRAQTADGVPALEACFIKRVQSAGVQLRHDWPFPSKAFVRAPAHVRFFTRPTALDVTSDSSIQTVPMRAVVTFDLSGADFSPHNRESFLANVENLFLPGLWNREPKKSLDYQVRGDQLVVEIDDAIASTFRTVAPHLELQMRGFPREQPTLLQANYQTITIDSSDLERQSLERQIANFSEALEHGSENIADARKTLAAAEARSAPLKAELLNEWEQEIRAIAVSAAESTVSSQEKWQSEIREKITRWRAELIQLDVEPRQQTYEVSPRRW